MKCENCNEEFDELVTRQGFLTTHYIEYVCRKCFFELDKINFEDYNADHYYGQLEGINE